MRCAALLFALVALHAHTRTHAHTTDRRTLYSLSRLTFLAAVPPCAARSRASTSFEMQHNAETSPLLARSASAARGAGGGSAGALRPGFSSPAVPPGIRVTKVAPVGHG
jgi:hypothetical protein